MPFKKYYAPFILLAAVAALTGCDTNEGPFEEAGEEVDQAVDRAEEKVEDAKD